ncbi:MAG: sodium-translocating pyrophosphatase, partial [Planctomycetota bacterium]|nr:sodium-translocating pyrophosphatase [Planctomycetota bacterium]
MSALTLADVQQVFTDAWLYILGPIGAILALLMAFLFSRMVMTRSEGEENMVEIAEAVRKGAMAYLRRQYSVVFVVFIILIAILILLWLARIQPGWTAIGVPIAGLFSGLCGWFGMKMATNASARTTFAAKQSLNEGLKVAFRSGAVMGLVVVGFALLDVSAWFLLWNWIFGAEESLVTITTIMLSYGMGASTQALFARVGGGIYTKAADVGADLVGKVEAGIPEDDPRNPATIADNVGDNVGDVAGMGADLYESYYGSILASMALGAAAAMGISGVDNAMIAMKLAVAPIALAGLGILASLIGVFVVRTKEDASFTQLLKSLHTGVWTASFVIALAGLGLFLLLVGRQTDAAGEVVVNGWGIWGSIVSGLVAGLIIAWFTEYYTSYEHKPTLSISEQAKTGPATVIIAGISVGMLSTWVPILTIVVAIICAFTFAGGADNFLLGLYGVGIAAVGMLSTLGITLATDAYGPIADNAGGNAEMTGQPPFVRERTDMLDALGNTTAATGKGFAIGSAALTALALLAAYVSVVQTNLNRQLTDGVEAASLLGRADEAYVAEYRGHGEFTVAGREDNAVFGGMLLSGDAIYK